MQASSAMGKKQSIPGCPGIGLGKTGGLKEGNCPGSGVGRTGRPGLTYEATGGLKAPRCSLTFWSIKL